jgi:hypothetical protein
MYFEAALSSSSQARLGKAGVGKANLAGTIRHMIFRRRVDSSRVKLPLERSCSALVDANAKCSDSMNEGIVPSIYTS